MMRTRSGVSACLAVIIAAWPATAFAQRAMTVIDLLNLPAISDAQLSPDGRQVVYTQTDSDWDANRRRTHVWRVDRDGTRATQLTYGAQGESSPRWSPDGTLIALLTRRGDDEQTQIYLLPTAGGEARRLTSHPTAVGSISWAPDGRTIYFVAAEPKSDEQKARDKAKDDVYGFDENYEQRHLWKVTAATGATERITSGDFSVLGYELSRDGSRIAHHRAPNPLFGYSDRGEVWVMDASGANARALTANTVPESDATLSPDNARVLFIAGANDRFETYYNDNIFVVPAEGGPARNLTTALPYEIESAA